MLTDYRYLITCEHASPAIPPEWRSVLEAYCEGCEAHEIWDAGTREIAAHLGDLLGANVFYGEYTRLLVDLNRSLGKAGIFSPPIAELPPETRAAILDRFYHPFRQQVLDALRASAGEGKSVLHISVHSFTPVFQGIERTADFGLLFDPERGEECALALRWLRYLQKAEGHLICKSNYPYLGISDGHTTAMRAIFTPDVYAGIELEFSQKLPLKEKAESFARWIVESLAHSLEA